MYHCGLKMVKLFIHEDVALLNRTACKWTSWLQTILPFSFVTVFFSQVLIIHMTGLFSSQTNIFSFLQYAYFTCSDHAIFPFLTKPFPSILQHYSGPNSPSLYMMFLGMPYSLVNLLHTRTVRYKHFYNLPTAIQPHANQRIITPLCKVTSKTFDLCI